MTIHIVERKRHGLTHHRFYKKWYAMMNRCYNEKYHMYKNYGGRGILVSNEFHDCAVYVKYLEELPGYGIDGRTTIDRTENDDIYRRGNLRWANRTEQGLNRRTLSNNSSGYNGVYFNKQVKKWRTHIIYKRKWIMIGDYDTPTLAAKERQKYIQDNNMKP